MLGPGFALAVASGCARWGAQEIPGSQRELARRSVGAPQIAETTTAELSLAFTGEKRTTALGTDVATGGATGSHGSQKRTHCVQQVEIDYALEQVPVVRRRGWDIAGGGVLGLLSISAFADEDFGSAPVRYGTGAAILGLGLGWIVYSYARLPSGPGPERTLTWTETRFEETTGCGLIPADAGGS